MSAHPVIKRPRVTVAPMGRGWPHQAWCAHCPWTYSNGVKSDVEWQARMHRDAHRAGRAEVTVLTSIAHGFLPTVNDQHETVPGCICGWKATWAHTGDERWVDYASRTDWDDHCAGRDGSDRPWRKASS